MTDTEALDETEVLDEVETPEPAARPRMRWGAMVWGLLVVLIALETLMISGSPTARAGFLDWWSQLTLGGGILVVTLVVGGVVLLLGALALIRRAQERRGR